MRFVAGRGSRDGPIIVRSICSATKSQRKGQPWVDLFLVLLLWRCSCIGVRIYRCGQGAHTLANCTFVMSEIIKEIRRVDDAIIVVVAGELTLREAPEFHGALLALCEESPRNLVVELSEVSFIDSSGVGTLTDVFRKMNKRGGRLALVGLRKMVRSVFEITRLDQYLAIFDTEEEALRS